MHCDCKTDIFAIDRDWLRVTSTGHAELRRPSRTTGKLQSKRKAYGSFQNKRGRNVDLDIILSPPKKGPNNFEQSGCPQGISFAAGCPGSFHLCSGYGA